MTERSELLAQVASLYYEENMRQADIARRVGISRSTISRLLQEAREMGIVEITVHYPWKTDPELECELSARFDLRCVRVLAGRGRSYQEVLRGLGVLAARYLGEVLTGGMLLGISWGASVYSTVQALRIDRPLPVTVVQMVGALGGGDPLTDGPDLARLLAQACGGEYRFLHAPLVVESAAVRDALLQEPRISETLSLARRADVALVGIGAVVPEASGMLRAGYLDREALARLRAGGAVGNVCGRHYDARGRVLETELAQRIVGIELEALHHVGRVIGVAGGRPKAEAILGALRGRHVNVLVTDDAAALEILRLDER